MFSAQAQDAMELDLQQCRSMAVENSETIKIADEYIAKAGGENQPRRLQKDYRSNIPTPLFDHPRSSGDKAMRDRERGFGS